MTGATGVGAAALVPWECVRTDPHPLVLVVCTDIGASESDPHPELVEDARSVTIALRQPSTTGWKISMNMRRVISLHLAAPLGRRAVLDGATGTEHRPYEGAQLLRPPGAPSGFRVDYQGLVRSSLCEDAGEPGHRLVAWSRDSPDARSLVLAQGPQPRRTNRNCPDKPMGRFLLHDGTPAELLADERQLHWVIQWRDDATGLHLRLQSTIGDAADQSHALDQLIEIASSLR